MSSLFPTYGRWDVAITEGRGSRVKDKNGKEYLDFISGIAVTNLGHRHEKVKEAISEQLEKVWHTSNLFQNDLQEETAEILCSHSAGDAAFFCNSGAEANEAAIKLARKHTKKEKIITFKQSFHGRTFATMAATGQEKVREGYGSMLSSFQYFEYNDTERLKSLKDDSLAAIMLEVVQGEGGVRPADLEFLQEAEKACKRNGALLIVDEVQTGIGRTGSLFAYQEAGLDPDIITAAKGLGSGFPVGAMLGKKELAKSFGPGSHGTTFGGNMLAMAAAKATLETVLAEGFLEEVKEKGSYLLTELKKELDGLDQVEEIRGKGLMAGIACSEKAMPMIEKLREAGLLVLPAGEKVIRLLPPLTVSKEEIGEAVQMIKNVLAKSEVEV
ncbi:acetylornithine transaminase [Metabacillus sp. GX 13764]|uniref:acetylornithine transaminase n=1 Tax=Metabacillus kandeliae TaxID=2900151 RepID=UPI001E652286|nr:acetylornithine transaminase [Metabacillus kandeliae]